MLATASKDRECRHVTAAINGVVAPITLDDAHAVGGEDLAEFPLTEKHFSFSAPGAVQSDQIRHRRVLDPLLRFLDTSVPEKFPLVKCLRARPARKGAIKLIHVD